MKLIHRGRVRTNLLAQLFCSYVLRSSWPLWSYSNVGVRLVKRLTRKQQQQHNIKRFVGTWRVKKVRPYLLTGVCVHRDNSQAVRYVTLDLIKHWFARFVISTVYENAVRKRWADTSRHRFVKLFEHFSRKVSKKHIAKPIEWVCEHFNLINDNYIFSTYHLPQHVECVSIKSLYLIKTLLWTVWSI